MEFFYEPDGDVLRRFMADESFVRGIRGPIGSGKSVACVVELFRLALSEPRTINREAGETERTPVSERTGPIRVRSVVVRNTTPMLETTTMKTWLEWLPEHEYGRVRWRAPYRQTISIPELHLEWEVFFLALDREEDKKKLLSFEFTNGWVNEAREMEYEIVSEMVTRLGRYPRIIDGGPRRKALIMDTNAPAEDHWWSIMSGECEPPDWMSEDDRRSLVKPANWTFFAQPPAMFPRKDAAGVIVGYDLNPHRENAKFQLGDYYTDLVAGKTTEWVRNMVMNEIGRIFSGRPVYQDFNERMHVAPEAFGPDPSERVIHVGIDWGLTPAAVFGQDIRGQVRVFDELVTRDTHTVKFAKMLKRHIAELYPDYKIVMTGDPSEKRSEVDKNTPFKVFEAEGMKVRKCWTNDPDIRMGAVQTQINTLVDGGRPGYLLSPGCSFLVQAKKGGYCYRKDSEEVDKKNIYSHASDAEQYMMIGMGYGKKLIGRGAAGKSHVHAGYKQQLFDRNRGKTPRERAGSSVLSRGRSSR